MAKELLPDALWARIAPLLPPEPPKPKGRRPQVSDRVALTGILFVLKTASPASPAVVSSPRTAWDATAGWWNGRSPGSTASGA